MSRPPATVDSIDVYFARIDLAEQGVIAPDHAPDFVTYTSVLVIAKLTSFAKGDFEEVVVVGPARAAVHGGVLTIEVTATVLGTTMPTSRLLTALQVVWIVDSSEPQS